MKPTIDQIIRALRACMVDEPQEKMPCESCYLFQTQNDGQMSTGRSCDEHLVLDTISELQLLLAMDGTPLGRFLREPRELAGVLEGVAMARNGDCPTCPAGAWCDKHVYERQCAGAWLDWLTSKEEQHG